MTSAPFLHPERWPIFLGVVVALVAWIRLRRARRARWEAAIGPRAEDLLRNAGRAEAARPWLAGAALVVAATAVLEPLGPDEGLSAAPRGADIVVAFDVSRSMWAADVLPDRLGAAKSAVSALLDVARGDRVGLVAFAGEARVVAPLSGDMAAIRGMLDELDPGSVERGGSDPGIALDAALSVLASREGDGAAVIVVTDAEEATARWIEACRRAADARVRVDVFPVGTADGAKIPLPGGRAFVTDATGADVVSRARPDVFAAGVAATGGRILAERATDTLVRHHREVIVADTLAAFEKRRGGSRTPLHPWFVGCALALFMIEAFAFRSRKP